MSEPIPMILTCPACCARHVDAGVFATKPHHTHACQACGMCWRPAILHTVGVQFLPGFKDEPSERAALVSEAPKDIAMRELSAVYGDDWAVDEQWRNSDGGGRIRVLIHGTERFCAAWVPRGGAGTSEDAWRSVLRWAERRVSGD